MNQDQQNNQKFNIQEKTDIYDEKFLSNNLSHREKSNKLDEFMGWVGDVKNQSRLRGLLHGSYHLYMSLRKFIR
jgi:hypothetical protein